MEPSGPVPAGNAIALTFIAAPRHGPLTTTNLKFLPVTRKIIQDDKDEDEGWWCRSAIKSKLYLLEMKINNAKYEVFLLLRCYKVLQITSHPKVSTE
jgi:hypothetical protein